MISHCTCYCWKAPGHLRDRAGVSAILFVCSFADPTLIPPFLQVLSIQFLSYVLHAFKQTCWCTLRYMCLIFTSLVYFRSFIFSFVGSDPDPSLFWCNNETARSTAQRRVLRCAVLRCTMLHYAASLCCTTASIIPVT